MTGLQRLVPLAIAAVIAVVAVVLLTSGSGDDEQEAASTPAPTATATATPAAASDATPEPTPTATPRPRPPLLVQGSPRTLRFTEGETIRFRVRAQQADHVHVHGYDRLADVEAGGTVVFVFPATITGIFEIELEDAGELLGNLRVDPR